MTASLHGSESCLSLRLTLEIRVDCEHATNRLAHLRLPQRQTRPPANAGAGAIYAAVERHEVLFHLTGLQNRTGCRLHDRRSKRDSGCRLTLTWPGAQGVSLMDGAALSRLPQDKPAWQRTGEARSRRFPDKAPGPGGFLSPANAVLLVGLAMPSIVVDVKIQTGGRQ